MNRHGQRTVLFLGKLAVDADLAAAVTRNRRAPESVADVRSGLRALENEPRRTEAAPDRR